MGDFILLISAETFGSFSACWNITLQEDDVLDENETITLELTTTDSFVTLTPGLLVFTIIDSVRIRYNPLWIMDSNPLFLLLYRLTQQWRLFKTL